MGTWCRDQSYNVHQERMGAKQNNSILSQCRTRRNSNHHLICHNNKYFCKSLLVSDLFFNFAANKDEFMQDNGFINDDERMDYRHHVFVEKRSGCLNSGLKVGCGFTLGIFFSLMMVYFWSSGSAGA